MGRDPLPWRAIVGFALGGTAVCVALVVTDVARSGMGAVALVAPGRQGPAAGVVALDFPRLAQPDNPGADGQQYYALARQPMHPRAVVPSLDDPRYRIGRPLLPWLAWLFHPQGGGRGLIVALFGVGVAAVVVGSIATGVVATTLGGPAWTPLLFALLPATYWSLRISTPDGLALALAAAAVALDLRGRTWTGAAAAVLSVLAKEVIVLIAVGYALGQRSRSAITAAVMAVVAFGLLWVATHLYIPLHGAPITMPPHFQPGHGLAVAVRYYVRHDAGGGAALAASVVAGGLALALPRVRAGVLSAAIALEVVLVAALSPDPLRPFVNASRSTGPLLLLACVSLVAAFAAPPRERSPSQG